MSGHTPGPWEANGNGVHKRLSGHYATCVAVCHGDDRHTNAKLIAAAPELADALRELHKWSQLNSVHYSKSSAAFNKAAELLRRIGK